MNFKILALLFILTPLNSSSLLGATATSDGLLVTGLNGSLAAASTTATGEYLIADTGNIWITCQKRMLLWWGSSAFRVITISSGDYQYRINLDERHSSANDTRAGFQDIRLGLAPGIFYRQSTASSWTELPATSTASLVLNGTTVSTNNGSLTVSNTHGESVTATPNASRRISFSITIPDGKVTTGIVNNELIPASALSFPPIPNLTFSAPTPPYAREDWNYSLDLGNTSTPSSVTWDLDNDGQFDDGTGTTGFFNGSFNGVRPGNLVFSAKVQDGYGFNSVHPFSIEISDRILEFTQHKISGDLSGELIFTTGSFDAAGDGDFNFSDSAPHSNSYFTVTYNGELYGRSVVPSNKYRVVNGKISAADILLLGPANKAIGLALNGTFSQLNLLTFQTLSSGSYSVAQNLDYLRYSYVFNNGLNGILRFRAASESTAQGRFIYSPKVSYSFSFITPDGNAFIGIPSSSDDYRITNGILSDLTMNLAGSNGETLEIHSASTFIRKDINGTVLETGTFSTTPISDIPFKIEAISPTQIDFISQHGLSYSLEKSSDLIHFQPTGLSLTGNGQQLSFTPPLLESQAFYRIIAK